MRDSPPPVLRPGLINRYRSRLPIDADAVPVSLSEGATPLVRLENLPGDASRRADIYAKLEGQNPTGSFKDRGMTMAITRAREEGARAIICASTGNTSASAAAYAARAGLSSFVLIPEGKIVPGQARPGDDARRARHPDRGQLRRRHAPRARDGRGDRRRHRELDQPLPDSGPEDHRLRNRRGARPLPRLPLPSGRQRRGTSPRTGSATASRRPRPTTTFPVPSRPASISSATRRGISTIGVR